MRRASATNSQPWGGMQTISPGTRHVEGITLGSSAKFNSEQNVLLTTILSQHHNWLSHLDFISELALILKEIVLYIFNLPSDMSRQIAWLKRRRKQVLRMRRGSTRRTSRVLHWIFGRRRRARGSGGEKSINWRYLTKKIGHYGGKRHMNTIGTENC